MPRDTVGGVAENDAIRRINSKKGFNPRGNKDSAIPPEQLPPTSGAIAGQDSAVDNSSSPESSQSATTRSRAEASTPSIEVTRDGVLEVTADQLREMIAIGIRRDTVAYQAQIDEIQKQLKEAQDRTEEEKDRLAEIERQYQDRLAEERKKQNTLTQVFNEFGFAPPVDAVPVHSHHQQAYIAPLSSRGGINARDAFREYSRILSDDSAMQPQSVATHTGLHVQRDTRHLDRWFLKHRELLREEMDSVARKVGLLQGRVSAYRKDAPTTFANFPVVLREYLSQVVRIEHSARFVLWQFVNRSVASGIPPGQTTLIPRVRHLNTGTTSSDWRLTPGTPTVGTRQNLSGNNISLPIYEYGMGKDVTIEPVGIADIVMQTNLLDLEGLLRERIGYNYHQWEDLMIFELLLSTTQIVYSSNDGVVETAAEVAGGGQITMNFLGALRARMANDRVPPLPDGSFIFVGTPDHIAQLETDMQKNHFYADPTVSESLINMFAMKTRNEYAGRMTGYKGRVRGFHVYEGTSFSNGDPGTPGVATETLNAVSVTTRAGFAMGADAIGWATSLPMEIREDPDTNFGRIQSLIWKSHENATGLDIDPDRTLLPNEVARPVGAEEQLRVYEVRSSMTSV